MAWFLLLCAGLLEIVWALGLKFSEGFSRLWLSVGTLVAMSASVFLLAQAMKSLPMGTAYAVWTGIGAVGISLMGILFLGEPCGLARICCILLIVCGIVGLKSL